MFLLGTRNITSQALVTGSAVNLGEIYRRYCRKNNCGIKTFDFNTTSVALQHKGIYHIAATLTFTAPVAGVVIFQLAENGVALPGAIASETITTATTEVATTTLDYYVLVDDECVLGTPTTLIENISILNTGVASTVTNVVFNVEKVV